MLQRNVSGKTRRVKKRLFPKVMAKPHIKREQYNRKNYFLVINKEFFSIISSVYSVGNGYGIQQRNINTHWINTYIGSWRKRFGNLKQIWKQVWVFCNVEDNTSQKMGIYNCSKLRKRFQKYHQSLYSRN